MVYAMSWDIWEKTQYNRKTQQVEPVAWIVTWGVWVQQLGRHFRFGEKIAGQDRKRFTDKVAAEKYVQGRIKVYDHLFQEVSPPVPERYVHYFKVNGVLAPGYTVAEWTTL